MPSCCLKHIKKQQLQSTGAAHSNKCYSRRNKRAIKRGLCLPMLPRLLESTRDAADRRAAADVWRCRIEQTHVSEASAKLEKQRATTASVWFSQIHQRRMPLGSSPRDALRPAKGTDQSCQLLSSVAEALEGHTQIYICIYIYMPTHTHTQKCIWDPQALCSSASIKKSFLHKTQSCHLWQPWLLPSHQAAVTSAPLEVYTLRWSTPQQFSNTDAGQTKPTTCVKERDCRCGLLLHTRKTLPASSLSVCTLHQDILILGSHILQLFISDGFIIVWLTWAMSDPDLGST